jgi:hypothetical protein
MKRIFIVTVAVLIAGFGKSSDAQYDEDTLKVLFVGNSYTNWHNLTQIVSFISDNAEIKLVTNQVTIGGAKLREHWLGERGLKTKEMIRNGKYDIVVLQEQSLGAINGADSLRKYAKLLCDFIRENGAKPYLYVTWAREKVPQYQETINHVYTDVARTNQAIVVPVGKTWERAKQLRPTIGLYHTDGSHPSVLGTYLTACVFTAAILREVPEKLPSVIETVGKDGKSTVRIEVDSLDVIFCQKIAREVVLGW